MTETNPYPVPPGSFLDLIELEEIDKNLYRAGYTFTEDFSLYGGQVAAQALRAAGLTVEAGRTPHSLHGYFLRPGDPSRPTILQVFRDRDGRSFSARRVVALQGGDVIFNMSASFAAQADGPDDHSVTIPEVAPPEDCAIEWLPRLLAFEAREVAQGYPDTDFPLRSWVRCTEDLGADELLHACALTYVSDISSGSAAYNSTTHATSSSLDHALWFHRPARADDWFLLDLVPQSVSAGRSLYTGTLSTAKGGLIGSLSQEVLFRPRRPGQFARERRAAAAADAG